MYRPAVAVLLAVPLGAPAGGASPQNPPLGGTVPAVGVELVQVDVSVTDSNGRPVAGLTALDFDVREDGKPQAVAYFGLEGRTEDAVPAPPLPKPLPPSEVIAPPARPAPPRPSARTLVIAVDDLHMAPTNRVAAVTALKRFVTDQVAEEDQIALVTTSGSTGRSQELTRDREDLRRALERISLVQQKRVEFNDVPHLTEYQAELIDRGDAEALRVAVDEIRQENDDIDVNQARFQAAQRAHSMLVEIMSYSDQALRTVESTIAALAPLPGRKMVVLCSDGFLVGLGSSDSRHFDLRRIIGAATRSGVVLYALDTRGLVSQVPGGDASFSGPPVLTAPGQRESLERRSVEALRDGMTALAEDTGGLLVANANDLSMGLGRILRDSRQYYVLAYEPSNPKRDGKYRKIEVRLRGRKGLRVRTRAGYFAADEKKLALEAKAAAAEPPAERRERELGRALEALYPATAIPVHMAVDYVEGPDGPKAVIKAQVDVHSVGFEKTAEGYVADLDVAGAIFDQRGEKVGAITGETSRLKLPLDNPQAFREQGLFYEKALSVPPGLHQVRLAVRAASLVGSASQWLEVPDRKARPLTLSSIFLSADDGRPPAEGTALDDVQVEKRFKRPRGLNYLVYVYRSESAAPHRADVVAQAQVWRSGTLLGAGPAQKVAFPPAGGAPFSQSERFATDALEPGAYELRVVADDRASGQKAVARVPFTVE